MNTAPITEILSHVDAGVMTITLNRVDKKNSITAAMYAALADALEAATHDGAVRAVVIQGHETIFSAGNDIGDFLKAPPTATDAPVFRFLRGISSFPKPLVAAVNGWRGVDTGQFRFRRSGRSNRLRRGIEGKVGVDGR